ncbi:MAG: hypothetical protein KBC33_04000 [Candidatus Pacebacteria bacterium]|nr:hypothetical protein [Candidatus Paceibacterota bacterium]
MTSARARAELAKDLVLIIIGFVCAIFLSKAGILDQIIALFGNGIIASFFAGIFFTSAFTLGPATVALTHIASYTPISVVALWGGLGALCGDLILFFFIRDRFTADLMRVLKPSFVRHIMHSLHFGFLKWLAPVIGALIIASPLPDEFGVALMGLSKTRLVVLVPVAFVMNMLGIYLVGWFSNLV